jgi:hypothetical protein
VLSNAVGHFGEAQLASLARGLASVRGPLLVAAHHHVWRDERFLQPEAWFETAIDADELVAILSAYRGRGERNRVLVVHGHRHILGAGRVGEEGRELEILALPSTTLGDKSGEGPTRSAAEGGAEVNDKSGGALDGILRYAVAGLRADGTWGVTLHAVGEHAVD